MRTVLVRTALFGLVSAAMLAVGAAAPAAAQPGGARNLGISGSYAVGLEGGGFAFSVSESDEGRDLNGDGDLGDRVVHRVDGVGVVSNVGLAGRPLAALDGGGFTFEVSEPWQGQDLNGDSDTDDAVAHWVDGAGAVSNVGLAGRPYEALEGGGFAFEVSEREQGHSLNGDWDTFDYVVHWVDGAGVVSNLGLSSRDLGGALEGGGFAFSVEELGQGQDLNGDGDLGDMVAHWVDGVGVVSNLGLASAYRAAALEGGGFAFPANEPGQGQDLNGDGDADDDYVAHWVDRAGVVSNVGLAGAHAEALEGGGFAFSVNELAQGQDLNGDGDTDDANVVHWVDGAGAVTNLGLTGNLQRVLDGGGFGFTVSEPGQGQDLNGDGDMGDLVQHWMDAARLVTNVGLAGYSQVALDGGGFDIFVVESEQGRDLNGDSDMGDMVSHWVDGAGVVSNVGLAGRGSVALDGGGFAFDAFEYEQGQDLNGDGDADDWVVHWVDGAGVVTSVGLASDSPVAMEGGGFAFLVSESPAGRDLNGDGDTNDYVWHMMQGISVVNVADPSAVAEPGGTVSHSVTVVNHSLVDSVTIGSLVDSVYGVLAGDADCQVGTVLAPGGSCSFDFVGAVSGSGGSSHTSTVTVGGTDDGGAPVSGFAEATVTITDIASSIAVTKDANPSAVVEPGGDVTYTVGVTNTSVVDSVTIGSLDDSVYGVLAGDGDCQVGTVLAPGGSCSFDFVGAVSGNAGSSHTGTVIVGGTDDDGFAVGGTDDTTVWITEPPGPVAVQSPGGDEIVVDLGGAGAIYSVVAVDPPVEVTPPAGATFPYGLVGFTVVGVDAGATVVVTVDFPEPLAEPFAYYKLQGGSYVDATSIAAHDGGRVTLTLVDNGPFDADPTLGVIADPGGPVSVAPSGSLVISKVFDPLSSGVSRTFPINWSCGNGTSGIVQVAGGGSATVDSIPAGTVCSVTESRPGGAPAGWYYANPTVAGSPATIAAGAPVAVTVTNTIVQSSLRDHVTMTLGGGMGTYDADLTGGDVAVTTDANGVLSVTGSGTVGTGTVSFAIRRFWVLPFHLGTVRVYDTGLNYSSFMLGKVTTLGPGVTTGTTAFGGDFSKLPWRTGNATFTVTDGD